MKFTKSTTAIFYNLKALPIQQMLDFDYMCDRTPSVVAIIHPGRRGFHKAFFGQQEILIPIYESLPEAAKKHSNAEVLINFASFRSAFQPSKEALVIPSIKTVVIVAEGVPEQETKELIALAKNNEVLMGAVYDPCPDNMYFAEKGKGAFLNNKKIRVSKKKELKDVILAFNLPSNEKISSDTLILLSKIYGNFRGIRNFGAAALNMCYLAEGKFDAYFTKSIKAWDVAAAKLIVEEAGGKVTNFDGGKWELKDTQIIASNKNLHNQLMASLK